MTAFNFKFVGLTLIAATIAALAATMSAGIGWPVWAMFIGWVAYFTGGHSPLGALRSYICVAIGLALGTVAALSVGTLMPWLDFLAFGVVVFFVAILVVSLRAAPLLNNIPAYFLGLITFFAAHVPPSMMAFTELAAVSGLGAFAALVAHKLQAKAGSGL